MKEGISHEHHYRHRPWLLRHQNSPLFVPGWADKLWRTRTLHPPRTLRVWRVLFCLWLRAAAYPAGQNCKRQLLPADTGSYRKGDSTHPETTTIDTTDEDGNPTTTEITETVLVIELTHKTPDEMAADYHFTTRQNTYLQLLQDPQYEELWAELLGGFAQGGGELMNPDSTRIPTGTLQWPLPVAGTITSQFGHRVDPITGEVSSHTGTDIACAEGTPILAAADGVVTVANGLDSWGGSYGYYIQIDHGGGLETLYAHCSSICVTTGQQVQAGEVIGYVGHTGRATGNHLHFEVHINGVRRDAETYFTI